MLIGRYPFVEAVSLIALVAMLIPTVRLGTMLYRHPYACYYNHERARSASMNRRRFKHHMCDVARSRDHRGRASTSPLASDVFRPPLGPLQMTA